MDSGPHAAAAQLARLDAIAVELASRPEPLALLALGSLGRGIARADRFSDLDFFVVVAGGAKERYIERLDWLAATHPIAFSYRNTVDGHKLLFADGIFAEMAVFTVEELPRIPFAPGRPVWTRSGFDARLLEPSLPQPVPEHHGKEWLIGEILGLLLVGLAREGRGETLSAMRLIQVHAVDRWLALEDHVRREEDRLALEDGRDPFQPERRIERRRPDLARRLAAWAPGYDHNRAAAMALLDALAAKHEVPTAMAEAIRALARPNASR